MPKAQYDCNLKSQQNRPIWNEKAPMKLPPNLLKMNVEISTEIAVIRTAAILKWLAGLIEIARDLGM